MVESILVAGRMENSMVKVHILVQLDKKDRENGKMGREKDGLYLIMIRNRIMNVKIANL